MSVSLAWFVADRLFDVRKFRALTVIDDYSRKCLGILVGQSIKWEQVADFLTILKQRKEALRNEYK